MGIAGVYLHLGFARSPTYGMPWKDEDCMYYLKDCYGSCDTRFAPSFSFTDLTHIFPLTTDMDSLTHLGYTHVSRFRLIFTFPFCIAFAFMHMYIIHAWTTDRYNRYYHIEQG